MTEELICAAVEKYVTSHEGVTDFSITYGQIMDEIDTLRIRTLHQMDRVMMLRPPYNLITQTIEFSETDFKKTASERIYVDVPRIFTHDTGDLAVAYVGSLNDNKQYRIVVGRQGKNAMYDTWNKEEPLAHFQDERMYLRKQPRGKFALRAIFERPRDLEPWGYNPTVSSYPLSNGQIDEIIGKTAESYIRTSYRIRPQPNQMVDLPIPPKNA